MIAYIIIFIITILFSLFISLGIYESLKEREVYNVLDCHLNNFYKTKDFDKRNEVLSSLTSIYNTEILIKNNKFYLKYKYEFGVAINEMRDTLSEMSNI